MQNMVKELRNKVSELFAFSIRKDKGLTYLLGAGASATKLPVISNFSDHGDELIRWLKKQNPELKYLERMQKILEEASKSRSIDTLARKYIHLKDDESLFVLKVIIDLTLCYSSLHKGLDQRYNNFISDVFFPSLKGFIKPKMIKVVSWNYDFQFVASLFPFLYEDNLSHVEWLLPEDIKLNGCSHFISFLKNSTHSPAGVQSNKDLIILEYLRYLFEHGHEQDKYKMYNEWIRFSWELNEDEILALQLKLKNVAKNTKSLVIIGYSFPFYNRHYDKCFLKYLPSNAKIYVQDLNCEPILQELRFILRNLKKRNIELIPIVSGGSFFIPPEIDLIDTKGTISHLDGKIKKNIK